MIEVIEEIRQGFTLPVLEEISDSRRLSVDPAELTMTTFRHNFDAKEDALLIAEYAGLFDRDRHEREARRRLRTAVSLFQMKNLVKLESVVVGQRFLATANDNLAITENDRRHVRSATGSVVLDHPKSFRTGRGSKDFNLYRGMVFTHTYRVQPLDVEGLPLIELTTQ